MIAPGDAVRIRGLRGILYACPCFTITAQGDSKLDSAEHRSVNSGVTHTADRIPPAGGW